MLAFLQQARPRPLPLAVLLSITLHRPAELEADLRSRGLRYSDRWRFDADGTRRLTLREIWVAIQWLPHDAALVLAANEGKPRWSYTEYLLADLFAVFTKQQHPWRPQTVTQQRRSTARTNAERSARRRFAARRRALASQDERIRHAARRDRLHHAAGHSLDEGFDQRARG